MYIIGALLTALYAFVLLIMRGDNGEIRKGFLAIVMIFELVTVTFRGIGAGNIVHAEEYGLHRENVSELIELAEERTPSCRM